MAKERYGAFLLFVDDWLSSTAIELMTPAEEAGYLRLLMHAWKAEDCGLPDDDRVLARLTRLGKTFRGKTREVLRAQFVARDGRLFNERLLRERNNQKQLREKRKAAGELAAACRWNANRMRNAEQKDGIPISIPNIDKTDLDCLTTNRKNGDSPPDPQGVCPYLNLREALHGYFREPGQADLYPSNRLVVDVMDAAGGASEQAVVDALKYLHDERGLRPGTRNGPRHWSWFKTVIADHFQQKRERAGAVPAEFDYRIQGEELEKPTEVF